MSLLCGPLVAGTRRFRLKKCKPTIAAYVLPGLMLHKLAADGKGESLLWGRTMVEGA